MRKSMFAINTLLPATAIVTTMISAVAVAQETTSKENEAKPAFATEPKVELKKISDDEYALGELRINKKTRSITFPATAEIVATQPGEVVEYVLVNPEGKIHESLFLTKVLPSHLNVAFKLLSYKESKHLFRKVSKDFILLPGYQDATPEQKKHSRFDITVSWKGKDGKLVSHTINQLIINANTKKTMQAGPWVYGGSQFYQGKFQADITRDIFALFTDANAIGNYAGKGREDDTLWLPNPKNLPKTGTKVTITLTPNLKPLK